MRCRREPTIGSAAVCQARTRASTMAGGGFVVAQQALDAITLTQRRNSSHRETRPPAHGRRHQDSNGDVPTRCGMPGHGGFSAPPGRFDLAQG